MSTMVMTRMADLGHEFIQYSGGLKGRD
jgi:hypothetical protein